MLPARVSTFVRLVHRVDDPIADASATFFLSSFFFFFLPQVYGYQSVDLVNVGDIITFSGTVSEYASDDTYLHLTELTYPSNITVLSSNNDVKPVVLGRDRTPPGSRIYFKDQFQLDAPIDVEAIDKKMKEKDQGLDFWERCASFRVTLVL